jgi:hypothetical protein
VHLVAFVYKYSSNHTGDEVLNVSEEQLLQGPAGVTVNMPFKDGVMVYPDPFTDYVTLKFTGAAKNVTFILYDLSGKKIFSEENISGSVAVISPVLHSGIYFYRVIDGQNTVYSGKIIAD